jgi:hypothetical protein
MKNIFIFFILFASIAFSACHGIPDYDTPAAFTLPAYNAQQDTLALFPVKLHGNYGYINNKGEVVIDPIYRQAFEFHEGRAFVSLKEGGNAFIDKTGRIVCKEKGISQNFNVLIKEGFICVSDKVGVSYKSGYMNRNGKLVIPFSFDRADDFQNGFAAVCMYDPQLSSEDERMEAGDREMEKRERWGFIDNTGKLVVPFQYSTVYNFSDGLALVIDRKNKYGFVDVTGKEIITCQYEHALSFSEGKAAVLINGKWGYIDRSGKVIITPRFEGTRGFYGGLAVVSKNNIEGYIDTTGKLVIGYRFSFGADFRNGYASVAVKEKHGLINRKGEYMIPLQFSKMLWFEEGLAAATLNDETGFIDTTGNWVIMPGRYSEVESFHDGLARVSMKDIFKVNMVDRGTVGYLNRRGELIWDLQR